MRTVYTIDIQAEFIFHWNAAHLYARVIHKRGTLTYRWYLGDTRCAWRTCWLRFRRKKITRGGSALQTSCVSVCTCARVRNLAATRSRSLNIERGRPITLPWSQLRFVGLRLAPVSCPWEPFHQFPGLRVMGWQLYPLLKHISLL